MAKLLVRPQAIAVDLVNTSTNTIVFISVKATSRQSDSFDSRVTVGQGQYRNVVASGWRSTSMTKDLCDYETHPTLPRYGTDLVQTRRLTFNFWVGVKHRVACYNAQRATSNDTKWAHADL